MQKSETRTYNEFIEKTTIKSAKEKAVIFYKDTSIDLDERLKVFRKYGEVYSHVGVTDRIKEIRGFEGFSDYVEIQIEDSAEHDWQKHQNICLVDMLYGWFEEENISEDQKNSYVEKLFECGYCAFEFDW